MSENAQETPQDGAVTVIKNGGGTHYDAFVAIGGAQFRFATFPVENVDAEIAETNRERQTATQQAATTAPAVDAGAL